MYSFSYVTFTSASKINLDSKRRTAHFTQDGEALTNAADSSTWKKRKQIKEKAEQEREARQNESDIQKKKKQGWR